MQAWHDVKLCNCLVCRQQLTFVCNLKLKYMLTQPGTPFRLIPKDCLPSICLLSTHRLPCNFVLLCWKFTHFRYKKISWWKLRTGRSLFLNIICVSRKSTRFSIFFLQQLVGTSAKQPVDILQLFECLKVTKCNEPWVNLTYLTQSPFWLCNHTATNPEKLLCKSGDGCLMPEFWRAHNGRGGWIRGTRGLFRLMKGALCKWGGEHSCWQRS